MDFDACPCSGKTLAKLVQPAILAVLAGQPLHGYRIAERIARMPLFGGEKPDSTGVYRLLKAMEDRGIVVSSWDLSERGPAKRMYRLTAEGRECLRRWVRTLQVYRQAIGALLKATSQAARRRGRPRAATPRTRSRTR